eukprot:8800522-Heterocapsa_arctica.AAC.1
MWTLPVTIKWVWTSGIVWGTVSPYSKGTIRTRKSWAGLKLSATAEVGVEGTVLAAGTQGSHARSPCSAQRRA